MWIWIWIETPIEFGIIKGNACMININNVNWEQYGILY